MNGEQGRGGGVGGRGNKNLMIPQSSENSVLPFVERTWQPLHSMVSFMFWADILL